MGKWKPLDGECEEVIIISYPLRRMEEEPQKTGVRERRGPKGDDILLVSLFSRESKGWGDRQGFIAEGGF